MKCGSYLSLLNRNPCYCVCVCAHVCVCACDSQCQRIVVIAFSTSNQLFPIIGTAAGGTSDVCIVISDWAQAFTFT